MKDKDLSSDIPAEYTVWLRPVVWDSYAGRGIFRNGNGYCKCKVLAPLVSCIG